DGGADAGFAARARKGDELDDRAGGGEHEPDAREPRQSAEQPQRRSMERELLAGHTPIIGRQDASPSAPRRPLGGELLRRLLQLDGEKIFRTYFTTARGVEALGSVWTLLDVTPLGRREAWEASPEGYPQTAPYEWWRPHHEYEDKRRRDASRAASSERAGGHTRARLVRLGFFVAWERNRGASRTRQMADRTTRPLAADEAPFRAGHRE